MRYEPAVAGDELTVDLDLADVLAEAHGGDVGRVLQAAAPGITDIITEACGQAPEKPTQKPHKVAVLTIRITRSQVLAQVSVPLPDGTELWA